MYDVAIIGLGPVGLTLALLLDGFGISVIAVEQSMTVHPLPRAIGIDHEGMRILQSVGIADALKPSLGKYCDSEYRAADGSLLRRIVQSSGPQLLAWPPNQTFIQPELDAALLARARQANGIDIRQGVRSIGLSQDAERATVKFECAVDQARGDLRARYVVGCDGASSFVRKALQIPSEDLAFAEPWVVVDVILKPGIELPDLNVQVCDPARPMTYVRGPRDLRRWEIMMLPGETAEEMSRPERIWQFLKPWITPDQGTIWRAAAYCFHALVAERWRDGRVFLAGDACHQTPPFLAQGLNQGLRDAANLAWKLATVIDGRASDSLLDTYEAERRPNVRAVIDITKGLGRIICERDPDAARARDAAMRADMAAGRGTVVRQGLLPPLAGGLLGRGKGTGHLAPQPWVRTSHGDARLDDVIPRGWTIFVSEAFVADAELFERARNLKMSIARFGTARDDGIFCFEEREDVVRHWLSSHATVAAIVRPDHAVYATCSDAAELTAALTELNVAINSLSIGVEL